MESQTEKPNTPGDKELAKSDEQLSTELHEGGDDTLESGLSKQEVLQKRSAMTRVREEYAEPTLIILLHGFFTAFGIGIFSFVSWLIDISHISETSKYVLHVIDEYLMVFAFIILGIAFIIKIVTVSLGSKRKEDE